MTKRKDRYTSSTPVSAADARTSCYDKRRFGSRNEARDSAAKVKKKGIELRPYHCLLCSGFHLTHWSAKASSQVRRTIRERGTA